MQQYKILSLPLFLVLIATPVFASIEQLSSKAHALLTQPIQFRDVFAKNWNFSCKISKGYRRAVEEFNQENKNEHQIQMVTEAELANKYRATALQAVYEGLRRMSEINPKLVSDIIEKMSEKQVNWKCKASSWFKKNAAAYANHGEGIFRGDPTIVATSDVMTELLRGNYENVLNTNLHEFLHLARVDNKKVFQHNSPEFQSFDKLEEYIVEDVVYACSNMVFTENAHFLEKRKGGDLYYYSKKLCEVCARAEYEGTSRTILSDSESARVRVAEKCTNEMDQTGYMGRLVYIPGEQRYVIYSKEFMQIEKEYEERLKQILKEAEERQARLERILESLNKKN